MSGNNDPHTASRELFLADLEHFEESIWRNEEIGEKRFNFFLTLVTVVAGGLVALWTSEKGGFIALSTSKGGQAALEAALKALTWQASGALLIFGLLSYRRMIHRDAVTAEYKRTTNYVRRTYKATFQDACPELREYKLPLEITNAARHGESAWQRRLRRICQAGYTQTLAVLNGVLLIAVLIAAFGYPTGWAVSGGILLAAALSLVGSGGYDNR